jgi:hypothetical protein
MPYSLFTFAAAFFATAGILLAIGNFTAHDTVKFLQVEVVPPTMREARLTSLHDKILQKTSLL